MKTYIAIFEVPDDYKPSEFVNTADGWFASESGEHRIGTKLRRVRDYTIVEEDGNKVMPQGESSDVDMQIRIIKGDLQYLSEKVDKLSSLIEEQKTER